ncbi:hypothetical protein COHA_009891 [Chlorella ohadii]|uniref:Uncharacterized protein n=1 Tax=Chlorella ohadii TaxID=2649997 RepID=A0AAD5H121_9CHLO|nr:hypothetical protein COHA_009891 [Chlorella ohadii]
MVTKRGNVLKKMKYYLTLNPPENILPQKKLNATARAVLEANKSVQAGLSETMENVQQRLLYSWLRMRRARSGM